MWNDLYPFFVFLTKPPVDRGWRYAVHLTSSFVVGALSCYVNPADGQDTATLVAFCVLNAAVATKSPRSRGATLRKGFAYFGLRKNSTNCSKLQYTSLFIMVRETDGGALSAKLLQYRFYLLTFLFCCGWYVAFCSKRSY